MTVDQMRLKHFGENYDGSSIDEFDQGGDLAYRHQSKANSILEKRSS